MWGHEQRAAGPGMEGHRVLGTKIGQKSRSHYGGIEEKAL